MFKARKAGEPQIANFSTSINPTKFFDNDTGFTPAEKISFNTTGALPEEKSILWWSTEKAVKSLIRMDSKYLEKGNEYSRLNKASLVKEREVVMRAVDEAIKKYTLTKFGGAESTTEKKPDSKQPNRRSTSNDVDKEF